MANSSSPQRSHAGVIAFSRQSVSALTIAHLRQGTVCLGGVLRLEATIPARGEPRSRRRPYHRHRPFCLLPFGSSSTLAINYPD